MQIIERPVKTEKYPLYQTPPVVIKVDKNESVMKLAVRIAVGAILNSPIAVGMGVLQESEFNMCPVSLEDIDSLVKEVEQYGKLNIDYWKGRPVKLHLRAENDKIIINTVGWTDRWNCIGNQHTLEFVIDVLDEVISWATNWKTPETYFNKYVLTKAEVAETAKKPSLPGRKPNAVQNIWKVDFDRFLWLVEYIEEPFPEDILHRLKIFYRAFNPYEKKIYISHENLLSYPKNEVDSFSVKAAVVFPNRYGHILEIALEHTGNRRSSLDLGFLEKKENTHKISVPLWNLNRSNLGVPYYKVFDSKH
ncbi:hypothetical protein A3C73_01515 [Candidatus Giovannonibacteria bacterium RIFCSPHIGHO2_02_FULL_44_11]|nr:MAG: hypothetical protein A3C73_01515 [Candidatus Giovannonibacteria bacterium RIFCSPHIGHO2_02_FULL_44_11]